jgi:hypothetical protein
LLELHKMNDELLLWLLLCHRLLPQLPYLHEFHHHELYFHHVLYPHRFHDSRVK